MTTNAQKTLVALAVVAMGGTFGAGIGAAAAATTVIYQDNFTGSSNTPLNGAKPTVDHGPSSTWTASSAWADSGHTKSSGNARQNAYLTFAPTPGHVYTLTVGLDVTGTGFPNTPPSSDSGYWAALGFITAPATTGGWDGSGAGPWVLSGYKAANDLVATGPGLAGSQAFAPGITSGINTYSIVLNTGSPAYSYQVFLTNSAVTNELVGSGTFSTNPAITAVGLENGVGIAQVTNFSLTSAPVPEPATTVIYQDNFTGSGATPLNGARPTVDHGPSST